MLRAVAACVTLGSLLLATTVLLHPSTLARSASAAAAPPPAAPAPASPPPAAPPPAAAPIDSFVSERDSLMKEVLQHIAGRENMPAESVFKNIKIEKDCCQWLDSSLITFPCDFE